MGFVDLDCPKCGARLHMGAGQTRCVCDYCGHEFLLDAAQSHVSANISISVSVNGHSTCYHGEGDGESGMDDVEDDNAGGGAQARNRREELLRQLEEADAQAGFLRLYEEKQFQYGMLSESKKPHPVVTISCGFVLGILMTAMIITKVGNTGPSTPSFNLPPAEPNPFMVILAALLTLSLPVLAPFLVHKIARFSYNRKLRKKDELARECAELENQYERHVKNRLRFLPVKYRHPKAITALYRYVKDDRADTLEKAIELYEKESRGHG